MFLILGITAPCDILQYKVPHCERSQLPSDRELLLPALAPTEPALIRSVDPTGLNPHLRPSQGAVFPLHYGPARSLFRLAHAGHGHPSHRIRVAFQNGNAGIFCAILRSCPRPGSQVGQSEPDYRHRRGHRVEGRHRSIRIPVPARCLPLRSLRRRARQIRPKPGEAPKLAPGALPMFKEAARPSSAEPVGEYAIKFHWNDGHELGIYSWQFCAIAV